MRGRVSKRVYAPVMIKPCKYSNFFLEANAQAVEKQSFRMKAGPLRNIFLTPYQRGAIYPDVPCCLCVVVSLNWHISRMMAFVFFPPRRFT